jgi:hypothetical protein
LLTYCAHCLKDLRYPRDEFIQCNACEEHLCEGCTDCLCERKKQYESQ